MGKFFGAADVIEFAVQERVARITLNRPDKRNALTPPMIASLHDALIEADARNDVNVIVLQGAGRDFCAGYDLTGVYAGIKSEADKAAAEDASMSGDAPIDYRTSTGTFDNDCWSLELPGRRHRPRSHVRHGIGRRRCQDWFSRHPRQRHAAESHVGLPRGSPMGE